MGVEHHRPDGDVGRILGRCLMGRCADQVKIGGPVRAGGRFGDAGRGAGGCGHWVTRRRSWSRPQGRMAVHVEAGSLHTGGRRISDPRLSRRAATREGSDVATGCGELAGIDDVDPPTRPRK